MLMRERRAAAFLATSFRKEPLLDASPLADMEGTMSAGSARDKIGAMLRLSKGLERGTIPKDRSSAILRLGLEDPDPDVRKNAIIILARHGTDFLPELCRGLTNGDRQVRAMSAAAVKGILEAEPFSCSRDARRLTVDLLLRAHGTIEGFVAESITDALMAIAKRDPMTVLERKGMLPAIEKAAMEALHDQSRARPC